MVIQNTNKNFPKYKEMANPALCQQSLELFTLWNITGRSSSPRKQHNQLVLEKEAKANRSTSTQKKLTKIDILFEHTNQNH